MSTKELDDWARRFRMPSGKSWATWAISSRGSDELTGAGLIAAGRPCVMVAAESQGRRRGIELGGRYRDHRPPCEELA